MTNFPAPPLDQIPLRPREFLMLDGFEVAQLVALYRAHKDRVRAIASYNDGFGGMPELERELAGEPVVLFSISVNNTPANCGDVEPHALTNQTFADVWLPRKSISIAGMPGGYTSVSNIDALHAAAAGRPIWEWAAHYGWRGGGLDAAHICGQDTCLLCHHKPHATQCYDQGPGGENVDISICAPGFLGVGQRPTPPNPEDYMAITAQNFYGVPHVFVEAKDGSIWYTVSEQRGSWDGGQPGKQIAGLTPFAPAPVK